MMFNDQDLAAMRQTQNDAMPDTALVKRPTRTSDSGGGTTSTLTTVATVACRVAKEPASEVLAGNREVTFVDWTITLPFGTDVLAGDSITVGARTYHVISVMSGSWSTALRAKCVGGE